MAIRHREGREKK